jgi:Phytanoyl-CoA dioxygenase (PhyH)
VANDPFWVRLISDSRLLDVAEQFVGPDIALFASQYICKPPPEGQAVLWHQNGSYWPRVPMYVSTLWLALDPSIPENGCMQVIPKTYHLKLQSLKERHDVPNVLESNMDHSLVEEHKAIDIILQPRDISIHHPNIIHGSRAYNSDLWQRGLTIRYIPSTAKVTQASWPCVMLLRGKTVKEINEYIPYSNSLQENILNSKVGKVGYPLPKLFLTTE